MLTFCYKGHQNACSPAWRMRCLHVTQHVLQIFDSKGLELGLELFVQGTLIPAVWRNAVKTEVWARYKNLGDLQQGNSFSLTQWLQLYSCDRLQLWTTCFSLPVPSQCCAWCRAALRVLWLVMRWLGLQDDRISRLCTASGLQIHLPWRSITEQARPLR